MVPGMCAGEEVVVESELLEEVDEALVVALVYGQGSGVFGVRTDGDGRAVAIRAGDHQDLVSAQALEARENIGGQVGTCQVADVDFSIGIRPGSGDQDGNGHKHLYLSWCKYFNTNKKD